MCVACNASRLTRENGITDPEESAEESTMVLLLCLEEGSMTFETMLMLLCKEHIAWLQASRAIVRKRMR